MTDDVTELADRLTDAAALVDECASLATRAGTALSALARGGGGEGEGDGGREPAPGQLGLDHA